MAADPIASTPDGLVESRILDYLQRELAGPEARLDRDVDLLSGGVLDSMGVLRLATFVSEEFGIEIRALGLRDRELQQRGRGCLVRRSGAVQDRRWRWPGPQLKRGAPTSSSAPT